MKNFKTTPFRINSTLKPTILYTFKEVLNFFELLTIYLQ